MFDGGSGAWGSGWIFFFYGHLLLLLYLVASATLPDNIPTDGLDLKEYYLESRGHFWSLLAGVNLIMLIFNLTRSLLTSNSLNWGSVLSGAVMVAIALSLAKIRRIEYHAVVVILLVLLLIVEITQKF